MTRFLALLIFLVGAAVGLGYPWSVARYAVHEIGMWRAQDAAGGFRPVDVIFGPADAPVKAILDITAIRPPKLATGQSVLTITAATGGKTVLARTLDLADATVRDDTPQTPQQIFRVEAGEIATVGNGIYTFTVGPGDAEGVEVLSVDLILSGGVGAVDPRARPLGLSIMAVGFILFAFTFRRNRERPAANPNSQPPPPRWGRGGSR